MISELYRSANVELSGYNIPRHEFIDLRQELVCQTLAQYNRMKEKGKEPDLLLLKNFLRLRKKELATRSFVGNNGGGTSKLDIMNRVHQWNGTFEKTGFLDELQNSKMNTRQRVEDNMSFYVDFRQFLKRLNSFQREVFTLLLKGFKKYEISRELRKSDSFVTQIINSVKEAFLKYFRIKLQPVN